MFRSLVFRIVLALGVLSAVACSSDPQGTGASGSAADAETLTHVHLRSTPEDGAPSVRVPRSDVVESDQLRSSEAEPGGAVHVERRNNGWCCDLCICDSTGCTCSDCHTC